jgi:hypothetical protein
MSGHNSTAHCAATACSPHPQARDDLGEEDLSLEALVEDDTAGLEAEVFALQSKTYPTTASSAFVNARGDIAPTPIFPNRPMVRP